MVGVFPGAESCGEWVVAAAVVGDGGSGLVFGAPVVLLELVGVAVMGRQDGQGEERGQGGDGEADAGQECLGGAGGGEP